MPRPSVRDLKDEDLAAWSIAIIEFVKGRDADNPSWDQLLEIVRRAAQKPNKRGLRMIARDMSEMAWGLSERDRDALEKIIVERFGPESAVFRTRPGK